MAVYLDTLNAAIAALPAEPTAAQQLECLETAYYSDISGSGFSADGYVTELTFQQNKAAQEGINDSILQALDGYATTSVVATVNDTGATGDGYIAFFTGVGRNIAGSNALYWNRETKQLGIGTNPNHTLTIRGTNNALIAIAADAPGTTAALELGSGGTGDRFAYIDLVGDDTYTDYGFRIVRNNSGPDASTELQHRGAGQIYINALDASSSVAINAGGAASSRLYINSIGTQLFGETIIHGNLQIDGAITNEDLLKGSTVAIDPAVDGYNIGEYKDIKVDNGTVGSWSSGAPKNVASLDLTPGYWDVSGHVHFAAAVITGTQTLVRITTDSADNGIQASIDRAELSIVPNSAAGVTVVSPVVRYYFPVTTTVYLLGQITFTVGTPTAGGYLRATRIR